MFDSLQLVECPRDAIQGWHSPVSTEQKVRYINALLKVGFQTIDFGSFVSPKAIPQMADTKEVLAALDLSVTKSSLLAIIANKRGAEEAVSYDSIRYLGFPLSVSETFQQRNTNSSIDSSLKIVEEIQDLCLHRKKGLVVYLSMGFGNPYGDPWSADIVFEKASLLANMGIDTISLADTVGVATATQVFDLTSQLIREMIGVRIGVHLHATPIKWLEKVEAAFKAGCRRFDGALKGIGGCPMAGNALVGNIDTTNLIWYLEKEKLNTGLNMQALEEASEIANEIFN
ncbi:hydroxymethylglutaryl-CoA lyase [Flavihumibacter sp. ZG627]|uniref:hydroxymethylglutaryl-CoA lyase n=1 Tax=Flavihumibacter sp. ZG627 TaxID=1463156 RepID=UPI00057FB7D2|nr:hydroxymethylglutaryl-CoA lyase [Flavihumibacter sp. ZG627]KIC89972.1 hydroxymethylglutaryl-CoA lyase [Flavihumibacter sp. ZG627]